MRKFQYIFVVKQGCLKGFSRFKITAHYISWHNLARYLIALQKLRGGEKHTAKREKKASENLSKESETGKGEDFRTITYKKRCKKRHCGTKRIFFARVHTAQTTRQKG
jgi:hypothetical protein